MAYLHDDGCLVAQSSLPEKLVDFVCFHSAQIVSVDVFDTLVWRPYFRPVDIFTAVHARLFEGKIICGGLSDTEFAALRIEAEDKARRGKVRQGLLPEVTISEIYGEVPATLIAEPARASAIACELQVESENLILDSVLWSALLILKARGSKIVVVSDFYVDARQMLVILEGVGATGASEIIDHWFISGVRGCDKANGLFALMMDELRGKSQHVVHIGDNSHADIEPARALGIKTLQFPRFEVLNSSVFYAEKHLRHLVEQNDFLESDNGLHGLRQRIMAAGGLGIGNSFDPFFELGVLSFGPLLGGFAEWITRTMLDRGLRVGVCVTREGLYLADLLGKVASLDSADLAYVPLLTCRKTLYSASFLEGSLDEIEKFVFSDRTPTTLREVIRVLNIPKALLGKLPATMLDFPLRRSHPLAHQIVRLLVANPRLVQHLQSESLGWRLRLVAHFRRQLSLAGIHTLPSLADEPLRIAFIDVGWSGTSQLQLQTILRSVGINIAFEGLYLATDRSAIGSMRRGAIMSAWLVSSGEGGLLGSLIANCKEIIEEACTKDVGAVIDYDKHGIAIHEAAKPMTIVQRAQQTALQEGIVLFLGEYFGRWRQVPYFRSHPLSEALGAIRTVAARVVAYPTQDECYGLSRWLHEEGGHFGRSETVVNRRHHTLIDYGTLRQAHADVGCYWLLGAVHERRPALISRLVALYLGYLDQDDRHLAEVAASLTVENRGVPNFFKNKTVGVPAYIEADGRGLSYRVFFAQGPVGLYWVGSTPFAYFIDRIELHCRYSDENRETVETVHTDLGPLFGLPSAPSAKGFLYQGGTASISAPFLSEQRPREIAIYVCIRREPNSRRED